ncbi:hypothetical protein DWB85_18510 [Seongchinamella sediminis]|uniref:Uncharacterized protein n=1 Tax=Seongchinamella sediminis TaxID=2283635 RepID=A0A3L7DUH7_9GAMM|nr:hypothetical protein DWB85_18510 [Seongchinamella sediminis]
MRKITCQAKLYSCSIEKEFDSCRHLFGAQQPLNWLLRQQSCLATYRGKCFNFPTCAQFSKLRQKAKVGDSI